ncbi:MAG: ribosome assembly RNA-binding protein YhbY [Pseudomonadales bacterium]|nr:ribosome assembly RNA-binding protein YhbY [Pseudomonadales bacterium]
MTDSKKTAWDKKPAKKSKTRLKRELRSIAHHLHPIVTVSEKGLADSVVNEVKRALKDHELIKVRLSISNRDDRKEICAALSKVCAAEVIQSIGKVIVLYKENPKADPRKSTILRYKSG